MTDSFCPVHSQQCERTAVLESKIVNIEKITEKHLTESIGVRDMVKRDNEFIESIKADLRWLKHFAWGQLATCFIAFLWMLIKFLSQGKL